MARAPSAMMVLWALVALVGATNGRRLEDWSEICTALENPENPETPSETPTTSLTSSFSTSSTSEVTMTTTTHSGTSSTVTTTVTSTMTSTTTTLYEQKMLSVFKDELKQVIKADGKLLVKDLMSWLITRLVILFVALTVATPLLILLVHRCSTRCQRCTARLKELQWGECRFTAGLLLCVFLLAAGGSILLAFNILDSVNVTIKEVRDYYLKTFVRNILDDILQESTKLGLQSVTTQRREQLNATLCNPTDDQFVMYSLTAIASLEGSEILRARLPEKVRIPPKSLGQIVVDYQFLPSLASLFGGVTSILSGSILTHRFGVEDIVLVSVLINTECKVRTSRAGVSLKINAPLLQSRLPDSFLVLNPNTQQQVISERFAGPDQALYHVYNALLGGLEHYRFFEFESLSLAGPLMVWVYGLVFCASLMFVISMTGIVLLLMAFCRCRCRGSGSRNRLMEGRDPQSPQAFESQLDSVVGRSLGFVEIDIPSEELKPKPHVTRTFSTRSTKIIQS